MEIDERIEEIQSKIVRLLMETDRNEVNIKLLQLGLDKNSIEELISAFDDAENAKNVVKNFWNNTRNSDGMIDSSLNFSEYDEREFTTRKHFDNIKYMAALLSIANRTNVSEIDDEILDKMYEQGIQETQIDEPSVRVAFRYYSQSKTKENEKNEETEKLTTFTSKVKTKVEDIKKQFDELEHDNEILRSSYNKINKEFRDRIERDEKYYQKARARIAILEEQLKKAEKRGVFHIITAKLTRAFGNKRKQLTEQAFEIPDTLYESASEKMGIGEDEIKDNSIDVAKREDSTEYRSKQDNGTEITK